MKREFTNGKVYKKKNRKEVLSDKKMKNTETDKNYELEIIQL